MSYLGRVTNKSSDIRRKEVSSSTSATHTLTWTAPNVESLIVTINGVTQQNNYTVSGVTLTLDTALISTDVMQVVGINDIGTTITPAQNSITNDMVSSSAAIAQSKLATLAIDTAELTDDAVTADKLANAINTSIAANTAKVTNATHTGDVTGATALTIATDAVDIAMLSATGTASSSTFLRGDNAWVAAGGTDLTPIFAVYKNGNQSISNATTTKITSWTELVDSDSDFDTTNSKFLPTTAGHYAIFMNVHSAATGNNVIRPYKNGAQHLELYHYTSTVDANTSIWFNFVLQMNGSTDYLEFYFYQDYGSTRNFYANSSHWFGWRIS